MTDPLTNAGLADIETRAAAGMTADYDPAWDVPALVAEVAALREAALAVLPLLEPVAVGDPRWRRCLSICGYVEVGETHRADCPIGRLAALVGEGQP